MAELTPPDKERCQARVPTGGPFAMGGPAGDPRDGYRVRCSNKPDVIIEELFPGPDGLRGSMSLCNSCLKVFGEQGGTPTVKVEPIQR